MISTLRRVALLASVGSLQALAVPPTPLPDPNGPDKNRYISMSIPDTGDDPVAIRVTLTSRISKGADPPPGRVYVLEERAANAKLTR